MRVLEKCWKNLKNTKHLIVRVINGNKMVLDPSLVLFYLIVIPSFADEMIFHTNFVSFSDYAVRCPLLAGGWLWRTN